MQTHHIRPLTGIRFFAAAWVVSVHFHPWLLMLLPASKVMDPVIEHGGEAVPFFFMLSGFILSHNYFPAYSLTRHHKFIFLRFARLWPVHFVTLLLLVASPSLLHVKISSLLPLAEELFMVRLWFHNEHTFNAPAWSISAEWFAYICVFPLAFLLFRRLRSIPVLIVLVVLFLVAQASPVNQMLFPDVNKFGAIFFLFLAGCGLYQLRCQVKNPPAEAIVWGGVILFEVFIIFSYKISMLPLYFSFALLIFGLAYERGIVARFLSNRIIVYGG